MNTEKFDLIVIGAGPGGYVASIRAAQLGLKTACIEKKKTLGGTCLNIGCIPSKALLESSEHYANIKNKFQKHGIVAGDIKLDLGHMMKRKDAVVRQLCAGIVGLFKKNKIESVLGTAKILPDKTVEVTMDSGKHVLSAPRILLATGSEPSPLQALPFDGKKILSSTEALELKDVPKHLLVIGGGAIGLELGSVWLRLGSRVTVVEFLDSIIPMVDKQAGAELFKCLSKQSMEFKLSTKCTGYKTSGDTVSVALEDVKSGAKSQIECDSVLVATGRRPYTAGLGLESLGIKLDKTGRVEVSEGFKTSVPGIFAIGDIIRGPMLAHKAEDEGIAVAELMAGKAGHVNYDAIPSIIYTSPEVASVGLTEEQAHAKSGKINVGLFPFMANGRAKAMEETEGFVKIIADAASDRVLGVHIVGPRASELIAEAVTVIEFGGSSEDIARTCHAHPTLSEVMREAALAVDKRQIHL
ncbi:MAG: dihydrolipoyl dehydrogenase [Bdellovibrionota bacterium]